MGLGWNVLACLCISLWSFGCAFIVLVILKYTMGIRLDLEEELKGSDEVEHNIKDDPVSSSTRHVLGRHVSVDGARNARRVSASASEVIQSPVEVFGKSNDDTGVASH